MHNHNKHRLQCKINTKITFHAKKKRKEKELYELIIVMNKNNFKILFPRKEKHPPIPITHPFLKSYVCYCYANYNIYQHNKLHSNS